MRLTAMAVALVLVAGVALGNTDTAEEAPRAEISSPADQDGVFVPFEPSRDYMLKWSQPPVTYAGLAAQVDTWPPFSV